jgi:hypothetical protein
MYTHVIKSLQATTCYRIIWQQFARSCFITTSHRLALPPCRTFQECFSTSSAFPLPPLLQQYLQRLQELLLDGPALATGSQIYSIMSQGGVQVAFVMQFHSSACVADALQTPLWMVLSSCRLH